MEFMLTIEGGPHTQDPHIFPFSKEAMEEALKHAHYTFLLCYPNAVGIVLAHNGVEDTLLCKTKREIIIVFISKNNRN